MFREICIEWAAAEDSRVEQISRSDQVLSETKLMQSEAATATEQSRGQKAYSI
jgi:hypothetical protein